MTKKIISRRQFLKTATGASIAAAGFPYFVPSSALGRAGSVAPSSRIVMGCIGVGGQGTRNMLTFLNMADVQIAALCDVNDGSSDYDMLYQFPDSTSAGLKPAIERAKKAYAEKSPSGTYKGIDSYRDFRELLTRGDIDAVSVCTPDHWHALVSVAAAKAGKDIYCEKPLANTVAEGKAIRDAVKRYGRVLQTGSHERSRDSVRFACELVRNGRIGKLHTIRINMPFDEPQHLDVIKHAHPHPEMPIPKGFDYDMWLGHTPYVPYTKRRCHFWWRFILNYGGGEMTDRGAHIIDIGQLGNNTDDTGPYEIAAKGKRLPKGLYDTFIEYEFEFKYINGVRMIGKSAGERGLKFEGSDGWIFIHIHGGRLEAEPRSLLKEVIGPNEIHLGRSPGHHRNFLDAVKSRGEPVASAEVGHRTATICHLTNIAMLTEQTLRWNPRTERVTSNYEADRLLTPVMRSPWYL
ncbi:MAG: Gfo/Idh/MocA family protein [Planctomycetota bacterium]